MSHVLARNGQFIAVGREADDKRRYDEFTVLVMGGTHVSVTSLRRCELTVAAR